jgi:hypothetical protein
VPLQPLATAPFPKLVVSAAWDTVPERTREIGGKAHGVICDVLAERLKAERAVFPGATHNPQLLGKPFNDPLRAFLTGVRSIMPKAEAPRSSTAPSQSKVILLPGTPPPGPGASGMRTYPYPTMRCGRIRNASRTRCGRPISPVPSRFGCLICIRTTSGNGTFSTQPQPGHT